MVHWQRNTIWRCVQPKPRCMVHHDRAVLSHQEGLHEGGKGAVDHRNQWLPFLLILKLVFASQAAQHNERSMDVGLVLHGAAPALRSASDEAVTCGSCLSLIGANTYTSISISCR